MSTKPAAKLQGGRAFPGAALTYTTGKGKPKGRGQLGAMPRRDWGTLGGWETGMGPESRDLGTRVGDSQAKSQLESEEGVTAEEGSAAHSSFSEDRKRVNAS